MFGFYFGYREVHRCSICGKVYDSGEFIPHICPKCGTRLRGLNIKDKYGISMQNENVETLIGKRTLFGWKFINETNNKGE